MPQNTILKITQVKSSIGYARKAKRTMIALGLKRIHHSIEKPDTPELRGMLRVVDHLVKVVKL